LLETSTYWETPLAWEWWGRGNPIINIRHYRSRSSGTMYLIQVIADPRNEMVLKRAFDNLVEQIGAYQFMNISTGKMCCEWLYHDVVNR
jgi:hypothetical protein